MVTVAGDVAPAYTVEPALCVTPTPRSRIAPVVVVTSLVPRASAPPCVSTLICSAVSEFSTFRPPASSRM